MKVINPLPITDAVLTYSSLPEDATAAWTAGTYAVGDERHRVQTHKVYRCAVAGVRNIAPESDPDNWAEMRSTNKWAMFNILANQQTVAPSPYTFHLTPGVRANSFGMTRVEADSATIEVTVGAATVFGPVVVPMRVRYTKSWSDYFFGVFRFINELARFNLPPYTTAVIKVTLTRASGDVKVGPSSLGTAFAFGGIREGATSDILDFSEITRQAGGYASLDVARSVPLTSQQVWLNADEVAAVVQLRRDLASKPALWFGVEDETHPYWSALVVPGIFRNFKLLLNHKGLTLINVDLEGI